MKTIKNKITEIQKENGFMNYGDLIKVCVEVTPKEGFTISDMSLGLKILEKINNDQMKFEDAEYEFLKQKVTEMKRAKIHKDIVQFSNDIV